MTTEDPIALDQHRGMAAQKATELRRMKREVQANEHMLRARQEELQAAMISTPAQTWEAAAEKAEYLISLLAGRADMRDPRMHKLMTAVFDDFARLSKTPHEV
jgi:hypothetical protein